MELAEPVLTLLSKRFICFVCFDFTFVCVVSWFVFLNKQAYEPRNNTKTKRTNTNRTTTKKRNG
jgi:hypothetical protein